MNKFIVFPIPQKIKFESGEYCHGTSLRIYVDSSFSDSEISRIQLDLSGFIDGYSFLSGSSIEDSDIVFKKDNYMSMEEYSLNINAEGIIITSVNTEGIFRALATFKQLLLQGKGKIPFVMIDDKPDFLFRGAQVDMGRGKIPTVATLKHIVDILADLKYNHLQLYFESITFKYEGFSEYCADGALTKEDIKEIDDYCQSKYIKLIPYQASLGHMANWLMLDEFKSFGITRDDGAVSSCLNPFNPDTFAFMEKIYDSILPCFSSDIVNIGLDEAYELGMGETKEACEKNGVENVFVDYLIKIRELINKKYNKKVMFWADMLNGYPEALKRVPKDCIILPWDYDALTDRFFDECEDISEAGLQFCICPGTNSCCSMTGRSVNSFYNIRHAAEAGKKYGAKGILVTDWGDQGHPQFLPISYHGLVIGSAFSWNSNIGIVDTDEERVSLNLPDAWKPSYVSQIIAETAKCYMDRFLFKCKENNSLADIIYRMGTYQFLENEIVGGTTRCFEMYSVGFGREGYNMQKGYMSEINPIYYKNVSSYIKGIIREIEACDFDCDDAQLIKQELICNCKMVDLMEQSLSLQYYYYRNELTAEMKNTAKILADEISKLKNEFVELWNSRNRESGSHVAFDKFTVTENALRSL